MGGWKLSLLSAQRLKARPTAELYFLMPLKKRADTRSLAGKADEAVTQEKWPFFFLSEPSTEPAAGRFLGGCLVLSLA